MSQENVDVVKRANALLNRGDWDEMALLWHPHIVFRDLRNAADTQQTLEGSQSVRALLAQWSEGAFLQSANFLDQLFEGFSFHFVGKSAEAEQGEVVEGGGA